ncbi:sorting nexin-8-like [Clavelina lepadiformis]|uniref:sorting nexin-8-like n=1 Tax=Clavelina lepadiformis TaxID=159417 RepID=UPI0040437054
MSDLTGAVPPYYRDVYDILCPTQNEQISQTLFANVLTKSGLERAILSQVWDMLDSKDGFINRSNLYKGLALVAFAQQGKTISDKLLQNFTGQELPKPNLGNIDGLKILLQQSKKSPTALNVTFSQCCALDTVQVTIVPEKKGIFLKHVEYEITSQHHQCTVKRRYNDFVAFHELLQQIFPYRIIPRLPPKKVLMSSDKEFIETRRKALRRFLNIVSRHPAMNDSQALKFFLTYSGHEVVHKIKEQFRGSADEYMKSPIATQAKDLVPPDTPTEFAASKEQMKQVTSHIQRLRDMATRISDRSKGNAMDMLGFGKELIGLGNDSAVASRWATGGNNVLGVMKRAFGSLSVEFSNIAEKHSLQGIREEEGVVDQLNTLYDLLIAYHDLCERHEKGVLREHHSALKKYGAMKTKRIAAAVTNMEQGGIDKIESKIVAQESEIQQRENRSYFSLHCIHLETQLVYLNMEILSEVVSTLVATQIKGHQEMAKLWEDLAPSVTNLLSSTDSQRNGSASPMSPNSPKFHW